MSGAGSSVPYWVSVSTAGVGLVALCVMARRHRGPWTVIPAWVFGGLLLAEQISWQIGFLVHHDWTARQSLPFDLCDITAWIAVAACWFLIPLCIELTYFWGLAGTLQAIVTPDVGAAFPHLEFIDYVVEHLVIVMAGLYLVVGLGHRPRPGSVRRIFTITVGFAAMVAVVDYVTGANYMFLRGRPPYVSLLNVLGPWPWYIPACAALAVVLFVALDLPFRQDRARTGRNRGRHAVPTAPS